MDVGDFLRWAESVPPVYRAEAARTLARAFFDERTAEDTRHAIEAALTILLDDASPLVRAMAIWAMGRLLPAEAVAHHATGRLEREDDPDVREEWRRAMAPVETVA